MKIEFSRHALIRMNERDVSEEEVLSALKLPDKQGKKDDTFVAIKLRKNDHLLIVIYKKAEIGLKVITVIDTSKTTKYL